MKETITINPHLVESPDSTSGEISFELSFVDEYRQIRTAAQLAAENLYLLQAECHSASVKGGWWPDLSDDGIQAATPTKIALIHSEISEALEGFRKGTSDPHINYRDNAEVKLADAVIRIFDLAEAHGYDLGDAIIDKMAYNATREDHTPEARAAEGGKKF